MKRGFTLVELLAAIVLMGVIIAIAVPAYNSYIEKSKKNTFKESIIGITRSLELYIASRPSENFGNPTNILSIDLEAENLNSIKSGEFYLNDGRVYLSNVTNGNFCANGTKDNLNIIKGDCN